MDVLHVGREGAGGALEEKRSELFDLLGLLPDFVPERRGLLVERRVAVDQFAVVKSVIQGALHSCGEGTIQHISRFGGSGKNALFRPTERLQVGDGNNARAFDFSNSGLKLLETKLKHQRIREVRLVVHGIALDADQVDAALIVLE